ncbi:hypothetical protein LDENG_00264590 [Lucifuga dentata]|nr:hypothetical protein LDENG_00264590 [Lucifuga dentata]
MQTQENDFAENSWSLKPGLEKCFPERQKEAALLNRRTGCMRRVPRAHSTGGLFEMQTEECLRLLPLDGLLSYSNTWRTLIG